MQPSWDAPYIAGEARRDIYTGNVATINIDRREENSRWRVGVGEVYDRKEMEKFGQGEEWHRYWQIKMQRHCVCVCIVQQHWKKEQAESCVMPTLLQSDIYYTGEW